MPIEALLAAAAVGLPFAGAALIAAHRLSGRARGAPAILGLLTATISARNRIYAASS